MSQSELSVRQAFDGKPIATLPLNSAKDAERFLSEADTQFAAKEERLPRHARIAILERLATAMVAERESFASLIAREGGKPLTDARVEIDRAINGVRLAAEVAATLSGTEIPMDRTRAGESRLALTRREAIGPVVAISAFNHPVNLPVHQVAPAIATGCPVIIKPAETTPLSCLRFIELVEAAGLPPPWCRAILCDIPTAEKLATDSRVAFFSFIGSAKVGWYLRSKLAPGTRCALEHGGAAPTIVCADANLDATVTALVKGGFYHAGQVCVSVQRIFADAAIVDALQERLVAATEALVTGDPQLEETDVGPLILPREVERVETWVNAAISGGAVPLTGARRLSKTTYQPTILREPPPDAWVSTREIFGPVLCLYATQSMTEAITRANSLPLAFQAAVFTQDLDQALLVSDRLTAGAVMINDHSAFRVDWMPFGGRRQSGLGVGGIAHSAADMTEEKLIVIKQRAF